MKIHTYILILFTPLLTLGQTNFVQNGDFEQYNWLPTDFLGYASIDSVLPYWNSFGYRGTPDYFHDSMKYLPDTRITDSINWRGYYSELFNVKEYLDIKYGKGCVGLVFGVSNVPELKSHASEYLETRLAKRLKTNHSYELRLYYRTGIKSNLKLASLDYALSISKPTTISDSPELRPDEIRNYPYITTWTSISNSELPREWTLFTDTIKASSPLEYLTLGSFSIEHASIDYVKDQTTYAYFFIDNISIIEIPSIVGPDTVCLGQEIELYSTYNGVWKWSYDRAFSSTFSTDSSVTIVADKTKWIYLTTPIATDSLLLTVLNKPTIDTGTYSICNGDTVCITLNPHYNYTWWDGNTSNKRSFWKPSDYPITADNGYCQTEVTITILQNDLNLNLIDKDISYCPSKEAYAQIYLPAKYNYLWLSDSSTLNEKKFIEENCYLFTYKINLCSATDSICITKACESIVWVPNAFVPNGSNKTFAPYLEDVTEATLIIYSRWGEKLYQETSKHPSWDGTVNNHIAQQGVYLYTLKTTGIQIGDTKYRSGTFTLLD